MWKYLLGLKVLFPKTLLSNQRFNDYKRLGL